MADHPLTAGPLVDPSIAEPPHPLQTHMGFRMIRWEPDLSVFEQHLQPCQLNRYGIPHGGIYAMLLDTVMGYCGCYTGSADDKRLAMTLSLTTNFIGRPTGKTLIAEGRRVGGGKRTFFAEGTIRDENDTLIATATGTFRYRAVSS